MEQEWFWLINADGLPIFIMLHHSSRQVIAMRNKEGWYGPFPTLQECLESMLEVVKERA